MFLKTLELLYNECVDTDLTKKLCKKIFCKTHRYGVGKFLSPDEKVRIWLLTANIFIFVEYK